jgi:DNA transposition AAA+ family ATPase
METAENIRTKAHLGFLKKEFDEHVVDTQEAIRKIEKRSIIRNEQMISLDKKLDDVIDTLADSSVSTRKGVITQTIENTNNLSKIQTEMAAWKRASVIVGGLVGGVLLAARYLFVLLKQAIQDN